ncbi:MAG: outer membrane protein assembly factor [Vicinamibacterales bacterium]|nr:outer membrane protein assembly factor [Vicinamibacterales bacterium]
MAAGTSPAFAQQSATTPPPPALFDVGDLWRAVRGKPREAPKTEEENRGRAFILAPSFGAKPGTGAFLGVAGNITSYFGDPKTTHVSTNVFGLSVSTSGQVLSNVRFNIFTNEDRWVIAGDNRFNWMSQDTFGLGTSTPSAGVVNADFDFFRLDETIYRRVGSSKFVGGGIQFNTRRNIGPGDNAEATWDESPNVVYSKAHGLPADSATSGGISIAGRFDSRDSQVNASRGWYLNASYRTFFEGFLGGDSSWQQASFDARSYRALTKNGRHLVAGWIYGEFVTAGVAPYYDLPATGMDTFGRSGRGYQEGRFRGDQLTYGELEYRTTIMANGLVGLVAFLNATSTSAPDGSEALFHSVAVGGGFGARLLFSKRSRTNLCLDFGWGREGSHAVYVAVQEAF